MTNSSDYSTASFQSEILRPPWWPARWPWPLPTQFSGPGSETMQLVSNTALFTRSIGEMHNSMVQEVLRLQKEYKGRHAELVEFGLNQLAEQGLLKEHELNGLVDLVKISHRAVAKCKAAYKSGQQPEKSESMAAAARELYNKLTLDRGAGPVALAIAGIAHNSNEMALSDDIGGADVDGAVLGAMSGGLAGAVIGTSAAVGAGLAGALIGAAGGALVGAVSASVGAWKNSAD